jgi:hypothetical protein
MVLQPALMCEPIKYIFEMKRYTVQIQKYSTDICPQDRQEGG